MTERVTVEVAEGVADVRLNRADKMNALDPAMFQALVDASDEIAKDPSVRCVVLSGNGRSFCAGLDFASFSKMSDDAATGSESPRDITASLPDRVTHLGQQAVYGWSSLRVPVIAAITGHALGGGIQLALGADLRIIHPEAKMSVLEIRWGLVPDMTGTHSLVRLVGLDVAKELTFTGRMVEGDEAVRIGLATKLSEQPLEDALQLARTIAEKSPHAVQGAKRLLDAAPLLGAAEAFRSERAEIGRLIGSPNQVEAVQSFFEKRPPKFQDPAIDPDAAFR